MQQDGVFGVVSSSGQEFLTQPHGFGRHARTPVSFGGFGAIAKNVIGILMGPKGPVPESTTAGMVGSASVPMKPQRRLAPPPGHPLFMQPPAVRAGLFASIAKKKMIEAKEHADIAQQESDKAEDEWRKSLSFATAAAADRDATMKYQLHSSVVRSLNRLVGQAARSEAMIAEGNLPLGSQPPELITAGNMVLNASNQLEAVLADMSHLKKIISKLDEANGFNKPKTEAEKQLRKLTQQRDRFQEIHDELVQAQALMKAQVPESHDPPLLPKRLLRPDGDPWWPERPPKPVSAHRLMLVKAFNPDAGIGALQGSAGAQFL
jgi:hypothetical protein